MYCSEACKQRAKRAIAKIQREAADGAAPTQNVSRLGKTTTEFRAPSRPAVLSAEVDARTSVGAGESEGAAAPSATDLQTREQRTKQRRSRRYANRRTLWKITGDKSCAGCGRTAMDPEVGAMWARTSEGVAVSLGLLKCGRIWLCPVCSAKIRHNRAQEITQAVTSWINQGGSAYLVTFTARHTAAHQLADLMNAIQGTRADEEAGIKRQPGAYQRLITGSTWAGRKASAESRHAATEGIRGRIGYVGMIRATEVTLGKGAGWHPHIHAIVLVGGRTEGSRADRHVVDTFTPSAVALEEWESHWRTVWTRHLQQIDPAFRPSDRCTIPSCKCGGKGHGVDFKPLETIKDAEDLGQYLAKTQDGKDPANELARFDLKNGLEGNMTPFQLLGRIGDLMGGVSETDAPGHGSLDWGLARWAEYETAVSGRRAMEWTRYLRSLLGLEGGDSEEDDIDLLFEMDAAHDFRDGIQIQERTWHKLATRGLDLAVVELVEGEQLDHDAITELALRVGGTAASVRRLNPSEVTAAFEAVLTTLAYRREAAAERRRQQEEAAAALAAAEAALAALDPDLDRSS